MAGNQHALIEAGFIHQAPDSAERIKPSLSALTLAEGGLRLDFWISNPALNAPPILRAVCAPPAKANAAQPACPQTVPAVRCPSFSPVQAARQTGSSAHRAPCPAGHSCRVS